MNARKVAAMAKHLDKVAKYSPEPHAREIRKVAKALKVALTEYQQLFQKKLKEHGHSSIKEMSTDEKKKFFNDMDASWKAENESD